MFFLGGIGYGQKYYFYKGKRLSSYSSLIDSGWYVLGISVAGSLNITGSNGLDFKILEWKKNKLLVQFGVISMYDLLRGESLALSVESAPSFLMPSINIKFNGEKK